MLLPVLGCGPPVIAGGVAFANAEWAPELSAGGLFELVLVSIGRLVVVVASLVNLLDMLRQGSTINAVIVAKDLYGFTTTEAKRFLEELQGR